jgi:hypothetical protein
MCDERLQAHLLKLIAAQRGDKQTPPGRTDPRWRLFVR